MTKIGILTFSTNSLTDQIKQADNIETIPLPCFLDNQTYVTGDILLKDYLDICMKKKNFPKTSQPSTGEIIEKIQSLKNKYDTIFIITPKHDLTGVFNGCSLAIEMLEEKSGIILIDTFSMAMGECIVVEEILKMQSTHSPEEIEKRIKTLISTFTTYAFPGSLKFLKMSGRVNGTSALVGEMLNLKTAIKVEEHVDKGVVDLKGRGYKSVFKYLENQITETKATDACITDICCDPKVFEEIKKIIQDCGLTLVETYEADIVPASHFGPQSFGLLLYRR